MGGTPVGKMVATTLALTVLVYHISQSLYWRGYCAGYKDCYNDQADTIECDKWGGTDA